MFTFNHYWWAFLTLWESSLVTVGLTDSHQTKHLMAFCDACKSETKPSKNDQFLALDFSTNSVKGYYIFHLHLSWYHKSWLLSCNEIVIEWALFELTHPSPFLLILKELIAHALDLVHCLSLLAGDVLPTLALSETAACLRDTRRRWATLALESR